jgi:hypothetical protein
VSLKGRFSFEARKMENRSEAKKKVLKQEKWKIDLKQKKTTFRSNNLSFQGFQRNISTIVDSTHTNDKKFK